MKNICLNFEKALGVVSKEQILAQEATVNACMDTLHKGNGAGNDFLGWLHLPSSITDAELTEIENTANVLRSKCEVVVAIGIGGSYLGTRAVVEAMNNSFDWLHANDRKNPILLYAGHNIGEDYLYELSEVLKGKQFGIINISKSGTTTEPAIAFRILKKQLEDAVGKEEAKHRIVAITDARKGALRTLADQEGYKTFVIPDNVGGRFSVLTPVGLLPIAVAGVNIRELVAGAVAMEKATDQSVPFAENISAQYAAVRNELYKSGKKVEILCNFHPKLHYIGEWWKQLYGESEGKDGKGIFPTGAEFTTDLHSIGQYIQEGRRNLFETVINIEKSKNDIEIKEDADNLDGLNYIAGKKLDYVNKKAMEGTISAHVDGGVPNIVINMSELNEETLGHLIYFFELAVAMSGNLIGVNPFNQPGVEKYKTNMFKLLKKPGYEDKK